MRKLIYVCSPYRGAPPHTLAKSDANLAKTKDYCKYVIAHGGIPIAPHLYLSPLLDDKVKSEREVGMAMGMELLMLCTELWQFGDTVTAGMVAELDLARRLCIPVMVIDVPTGGKQKVEVEREIRKYWQDKKAKRAGRANAG